MPPQFITPEKTGQITGLLVYASLGFLLCMYLIKYELATLGVATDRRGLYLVPLQLWRAIKHIPEPKSKLWFVGVMMWFFAITTIIIFPFALYFTFVSLFQ